MVGHERRLCFWRGDVDIMLSLEEWERLDGVGRELTKETFAALHAEAMRSLEKWAVVAVVVAALAKRMDRALSEIMVPASKYV